MTKQSATKKAKVYMMDGGTKRAYVSRVRNGERYERVYRNATPASRRRCKIARALCQFRIAKQYAAKHKADTFGHVIDENYEQRLNEYVAPLARLARG